MDEGLHLYCLVEPDRSPPEGLRGLEDGAVRRLDVGRLAAWVTALEGRPSPSLERVRRHNRVVEAAMSESSSPIPVRFGEWFGSREELLDAVREDEGAYLRRLEGLRGAVEFGVRVVDPDRSAPAERPGAAESGRVYMERLARAHAEERAARGDAERLAEALAAHVGSLARDARVDLRAPEGGLVSVAHLVARADEAAYRRAVGEFAERTTDVQFRVSGPWPPYSFVE